MQHHAHRVPVQGPAEGRVEDLQQSALDHAAPARELGLQLCRLPAQPPGLVGETAQQLLTLAQDPPLAGVVEDLGLGEEGERRGRGEGCRPGVGGRRRELMGGWMGRDGTSPGLIEVHGGPRGLMAVIQMNMMGVESG